MIHKTPSPLAWMSAVSVSAVSASHGMHQKPLISCCWMASHSSLSAFEHLVVERMN